MFLFGFVFVQFVKEVGFFFGVFNIIFGFGKIVGVVIFFYMDIDKVVFIGFIVVGCIIMKVVVFFNFKKVIFELGGKFFNIVFNDVDIEQIISWVNFGIYFNYGQCCCVGFCIYVQFGIYDKFVVVFKKCVEVNKVGDLFYFEIF